MKAADVPLRAGAAVRGVLVASGYGARFGVWDFRLGFQTHPLELLRRACHRRGWRSSRC